jgi:tetratricopeptide (TPR) repeat protein
MKNRVMVLSLLVVVLVVAAIGGKLYLDHRQSGSRPLIRADVALQARQYEKAARIAGRVARDRPKDWQARRLLGLAHLALGRYSQAQQALSEAVQLRPGNADLLLSLADTYAFPARGRLSPSDHAPSPENLLQAVEELKQANQVLSVEALDPDRQIDLRQHIGMNQQTISLALGRLSDLLARKARTDEASRMEKQAEENYARSAEVRGEADGAADEAIDTLLSVIREDPTRGDAARSLVELCLDRGNEEALREARERILSQDKPPAVAAMRILFHDLASSGSDRTVSERRRELEGLADRLDEFRRETPDEAEITITRARVALMLDDLAVAEDLCEEVLENNPRDRQARLFQAEALIRRGAFERAEQLLFKLRAEYPNWVSAHVAYARAAEAVGGKQEAVREAMRTVTELDPRHPDARRYLAGSLLMAGFADQAFMDAREYHNAHPNDPRAVKLFAVAAQQTGQPNRARQVLESALEDHPDAPQMLTAVADAFVDIGDPARATEVMRQAAECKSQSTAGRLAIARALRLTDRVSQAESLLLQAAKVDPDSAEAHFQLGQLYQVLGRSQQAIDQYRIASQLDRYRVGYRISLARTLFDVGDLGRSAEVLDQIESASEEASLLRLQLRLAQGGTLEEDEAGGVQAQGTGRALAETYLASGQPERCEQLCLSELKKTPSDQALRYLLGRAYQEMGRPDDCVAQWSQIIEAAPDRLQVYFMVADVLAANRSPRQIRERLNAIPSARADLVELAMSQRMIRSGELKQAAESLALLAGDEKTPQYTRNRSHLLHAEVTARLGDAEAAIEELESLASEPGWARAALAAEVDILFATGQINRAATGLQRLKEEASRQQDANSLETVARMYARMGKVDEALEVFDRVVEIRPFEAGPLASRAQVLIAVGRPGEAVNALQKAIELQPGNLDLYVALAGAFDLEQDPRAALSALEKMKPQGQSAEARALYERGRLLMGWGLSAPAVEAFQALVGQGQAPTPALKLGLAQALAGLGEHDRARSLLEGISSYSPRYVEARMLLASIAPNVGAKVKALEELERTRPGQPGALIQRMSLLSGAGRSAEAVEAFQSYRETNGEVPQAANDLAFTAMLDNGDHAGAAEFAARLAQSTGMSRWRHFAVLLRIDDSADAAAGLLPAISEASLVDALLGVVVSRRLGYDSLTEKWHDRIVEAGPEGVKRLGPGAPSYQLLAALAAKRGALADETLERFTSRPNLGRQPALELVAQAKTAPEATASEAARLLQATLATDMGLAAVGRTWAMEILRKRDQSQWAGALILETRPGLATRKEMQSLLRPSDCVLSRVVGASILELESRNEEAAERYREIAGSDGDDPQLQMNAAMAYEKAGKLVEALEIYRRIWAQNKDVRAANNLAYVISQLHPDDPDQLVEAAQTIAAAVEAVPGIPAFRDTLGWVNYLQGRKEEAREELWRAVKGMQRSPEAHYHVGMAEADVGDREIAGWHLAAAVAWAQAAEAEGNLLTPAETKASELAKKALVALEELQS